MPIRYFLRPNTLNTSQDNYVANVKSVDILNDEEIIARMVRRGTTLTQTDLLAAISLYQETIAELVAEGYGINTDLVRYGASIRGTFAATDAPFQPDKHAVTPTVQPGRRLRQTVARARTERIEASVRAPQIRAVYNQADDSRNQHLTPGQMVRLVGSGLKYDPADNEQGIFFLPAAGPETRAAQVVVNRQTELICLVPALPAGPCTIEVRVLLDKTLRHGRSHPLTVTPAAG